AAAPLDQKLALARKYLAKVPPAVEGQGGDRRTFGVACLLVLDFDLSPDAALPLLLEWNQTCSPPWDEDELKRKLETANGKPGGAGRAGTTAGAWHRADRPSPAWSPTSSGGTRTRSSRRRRPRAAGGGRAGATPSPGSG